MTARSLHSVGLGSLVLASLGLALGATSSTPETPRALRPPPPPPPVALEWTADLIETGTWSSAVQMASNWEEGGHTDWRLPTVDELQDALEDGSFGGTSHLNLDYFNIWSGTANGNWAWVCKLVTDANGDPIPPSGEKKKKEWKGASGGGMHDAKFVREVG